MATDEQLSALESRIEQLEKRVADLESDPNAPHDAIATGRIVFGGELEIGGGNITYSWERPAWFLTGDAWEPSFQRIAALASPIRAHVLRRLVEKPATVAELVDDGVFTSTGKAYHHLNDLLKAGWLEKDAQGKHSVPPARIVPLMVIAAAGEDH
ncbi:winged helix-turn-helix domain-containing protein [Corynebacterium breve]|uniref:Winged helix-turn-helix domain-containing protein n=1 Tax=Corynebacterium breve TaxID=3049799 RepID=A0ABY8VIM4_9CORY|nr:winged helix-turn-helix domain-containing protein [Corynebacterium breve]WIM68059.1 winged helix-turn-helix domain-containing protein [Corynebacterium breve]